MSKQHQARAAEGEIKVGKVVQQIKRFDPRHPGSVALVVSLSTLTSLETKAREVNEQAGKT